MTIYQHRWCRFSLRTVFIAFTVTGTWLAWNANLVRQRREAIMSPTSEWAYRTASSQTRIPWIRRLMGDAAVESVLLGTWAPEDEFQRAERLFPEATVRRNVPFRESFLESL